MGIVQDCAGLGFNDDVMGICCTFTGTFSIANLR
jgi:hypothetical protein